MPVISDITTNHKVVHYGLALSYKQSMPKTQLMSITFRIGSKIQGVFVLKLVSTVYNNRNKPNKMLLLLPAYTRKYKNS